MRHPSTHAAALVLLLLSSAPPAGAAEPPAVRWRTDYNAARKEAEEKGLPMLVEVGSDNCPNCVRQDATTFRDPGIITLLNTHFVPLKIDGNQDMTLTEALKVQVYPTTVLAAPDGKVLDFLQGYTSADQLRDRARRAAAAGARDLLAAAREEFRARRYADCLDRCELIAARFSDFPEGRDAAALAERIQDDPARLSAACDQLNERAAAMCLALAEAWLKKGQPSDARACLERVVRLSPSGKAAEAARAKLAALAKADAEAVNAGVEPMK